MLVFVEQQSWVQKSLRVERDMNLIEEILIKNVNQF